MKTLNGKIAVLTGATEGLGLASAKAFADEGSRVFITGRDQHRLDAAVAAIGACATGVRADSSSPANLDALFSTVAGEAGHIDILFVSAGTVRPTMLGAITEEDIQAIFGLNVGGTIHTVQKALPLLRDGASIILVGSVATRKVFMDSSVYAASKAAVATLAKAWALELSPRGIRVNTLSPGPTETTMMRAAPPEMAETFRAGIPFGRLGQPEDIAAAAAFLASDASAFITGVDLPVDGGMSAT